LSKSATLPAPKENAVMNRMFAALALALSLASTSAVALADTSAPAQGRHQRGDEAKKFPMPAAEFQAKVAAHQAKAREHLEKRLAEKKVPADKADAIRAKVAAKEAAVAAKVAEVGADGTVTLPEAKEVRAIEHQGRPEHRKPRGERTPEQGQRLASRHQHPDDRSPPELSLRVRSRWGARRAAVRVEGQTKNTRATAGGEGELSASGCCLPYCIPQATRGGLSRRALAPGAGPGSAALQGPPRSAASLLGPIGGGLAWTTRLRRRRTRRNRC
jgi:hypothetical protein